MAARARVDDSGIYLEESLGEPVDVRFGGHRLWSFNASRDGTPTGKGRHVPWPGRSCPPHDPWLRPAPALRAA